MSSKREMMRDLAENIEYLVLGVLGVPERPWSNPSQAIDEALEAVRNKKLFREAFEGNFGLSVDEGASILNDPIKRKRAEELLSKGRMTRDWINLIDETVENARQR